MKLFNTQNLDFKRDGDTVTGFAVAVDRKSLYEGNERFLLVARSKAGIRRALREFAPEIPHNPEAVLKVEVKLL